MAQIGISVDKDGNGQIFTDRSGTLPCEKLVDVDVSESSQGGYPPPKCGRYGLVPGGGKVTFGTSGIATCDKCGQTYKVYLSG